MDFPGGGRIEFPPHEFKDVTAEVERMGRCVGADKCYRGSAEVWSAQPERQRQREGTGTEIDDENAFPLRAWSGRCGRQRQRQRRQQREQADQVPGHEIAKVGRSEARGGPVGL